MGISSSLARLAKVEANLTLPDPIQVILPHLIEFRLYQQKAWDALYTNKCNRGLLIWHRRAGKDKFCFNYMIKRAWEELGIYYYVFPTYRQGKLALWEGRDKTGRAFLDHIPNSIISLKNSSELKIVLKNGSIIRIVGSDNIDSVMGTAPRGLVMSEYSLQRPNAWDYLRPILLENKGWALFNGTPRGKNHFYDMYQINKDSKSWYVDIQTVKDTGTVSEADIEAEREQGMSEEIVQQEFYCSFDRGSEGTFYGKYLRDLEADGRITSVPYDPYQKVDTFWDLGVADPSVVIFAQRIEREIHIIDFYEMNGCGLDHYAKMLDAKPYKYGTHYAPHDIKVRALGIGTRSRLQIAQDLGIPFQVVPDVSVIDGIEITRSIFSRLWFDAKKCAKLIKRIENYCKRYNEQYNVFNEEPVKNGAQHAADALRMLGVSYVKSGESKTLEEIEWEDRKYSVRGMWNR